MFARSSTPVVGVSPAVVQAGSHSAVTLIILDWVYSSLFYDIENVFTFFPLWRRECHPQYASLVLNLAAALIIFYYSPFCFDDGEVFTSQTSLDASGDAPSAFLSFFHGSGGDILTFQTFHGFCCDAPSTFAHSSTSVVGCQTQ